MSDDSDDREVHHHHHYHGDVPPPQAVLGKAPSAGPLARRMMPGGDERTGALVTGALIGAGAVALVSNERLQRSVLRGAVQMWNRLHSSVEEFKERLNDAQAEVESAAQMKASAEAPAPMDKPSGVETRAENDDRL